MNTAAPALFAFMGSASFSLGLSAWRSACAPIRCGNGWLRSAQRKQIIRTHLLSETSSDYIGLVRLKGLEPTRIAAREPKSFGLFFRPQLSTALRSRKPLKTQGFVHFRARLRRENKMQNFLVGENQGENSQRTGENFLGPITGRTNYDKPHDPLLMAILQEVVKHEVESILRGNLFSIP